MEYARHIGRVGALAVALGVGAAVVFSPGIASADTPDGGPTGKDSTAATDTTSTDPSGTTPTGTATAPAVDPPKPSSDPGKPGTTTVTSTTTGVTGTETVLGDKDAPTVIIRSSGGELSANKEVDSTATATVKPSADARPTTDPTATIEATATAKPEPKPESTPTATAKPTPLAAKSNSADDAATKAPATEAPKVKVSTKLDADPQPKLVVDTPSEVDVDLTPMAARSAGTDVSTLVAPPPPPDPVAAFVAIPATIIGVAAQLVSAALAPFLAPSTPGPSPETPLVWAVLGWVRRQFFNEAPQFTPTVGAPDSSGKTTISLVNNDVDHDELTYTASAQNGTVQIVGNTVVYTPNTGFKGTDTVSITASDATNAHVHLFSILTPDGGHTATKTVTIVTENKAPVVTTSTVNTSYTEGQSTPVTVDPGITVTDPDSTTLTGATVTITAGKDDGDTLAYNAIDGNPVTGSYNSTTGILTLTGDATAGQYQEALRAVTFAATTDNPTVAKTISVVVIDEADAASVAAAKTVAVAGVNDLPTITTTPGSTAYTEGQPTPVAVDPGITITDTDTPLLTGATVIIISGEQPGDTLSYIPIAGNPITGSYNPATATLTLTGAATAAQYQEALRTVTFASTSDTPSTTKALAIVMTQDSSVPGGGPAVGVVAATKTLTVTPTNDAPVVSVSNYTPTPAEGGPAVVIDPNVTVTDPDSKVTGATVVITGNRDPGDKLIYTPIAGNPVTGSYDQATGILTLTGEATAAQYQEALRSVTFESGIGNIADSRTFTFTVTDDAQATGTVDKTVAVDTNTPPVITVSPFVDFPRGGPPVAIFPDLTVTDADGVVTSATIRAFVVTGEQVVYTQPAGNPVVAQNLGNGIIRLTGGTTAAQYQEAIRSVTFYTSSFVLVQRNVTVTVSDGIESSSTLNATVSVVP